MKTITQAEFASDPEAVFAQSRLEPIGLVGDDGRIRMYFHCPTLEPDECCIAARAAGVAAERSRCVAIVRRHKRHDWSRVVNADATVKGELEAVAVLLEAGEP